MKFLISDMPQQFLKADEFIFVILAGRVIFVSHAQSANASLSMVVSVDGKLSCFKPLQFLKAQFPIETNDNGRSIFNNFLLIKRESGIVSILTALKLIETKLGI